MKAFLVAVCLLAAAVSAQDANVNTITNKGFAYSVLDTAAPSPAVIQYAHNLQPVTYHLAAGSVQASAPVAVVAGNAATYNVAAAAQPVLAYAAQPVTYAHAAYVAVNPYDYAGQVHPVAEPYIHQEVEAEPYIHQEVEAEPYIHQEIPAEEYKHEEIPAEEYKHEEIPAEPYVHQEPAEPQALVPVAVQTPVISQQIVSYATPAVQAAPVAVPAAPQTVTYATQAVQAAVPVQAAHQVVSYATPTIQAAVPVQAGHQVVSYATQAVHAGHQVVSYASPLLSYTNTAAASSAASVASSQVVPVTYQHQPVVTFQAAPATPVLNYNNLYGYAPFPYAYNYGYVPVVAQAQTEAKA